MYCGRSTVPDDKSRTKTFERLLIENRYSHFRPGAASGPATTRVSGVLIQRPLKQWAFYSLWTRANPFMLAKISQLRNSSCSRFFQILAVCAKLDNEPLDERAYALRLAEKLHAGTPCESAIGLQD